MSKLLRGALILLSFLAIGSLSPAEATDQYNCYRCGVVAGQPTCIGGQTSGGTSCDFNCNNNTGCAYAIVSSFTARLV